MIFQENLERRTLPEEQALLQIREDFKR